MNSPAQRARGRQIDRYGQVGLLRHCLTTVVEITGDVETAWLQGALDRVVARHPALGAVFDPGWEHHTLLPDARVPLTRRIVVGTDPGEREEWAAQFAHEDRMRPFDLVAGPVMRATLLSAARLRHLLVLSFDQMVIDAQSAVTVVAELVDTADALAAGRPLPPADPDPYPRVRSACDAWLAGPEGQRAVERRAHALEGTTLGMPWPPRPDTADPDALAHGTTDLPEETGTALLSLAKQARVVPFAVALAAFGLVVAAADAPSGEGDSAGEGVPEPASRAVTSMFAARVSDEEREAVGWLSNRVAVPLPPPCGTVAAYVRAAQRHVMSALDAQRVPLTPEEAAHEGDSLTASLLYLPEQLSGGRQTELRIGDAVARRLAVSFCPTGADIDLFVVEGVRRLTGEQATLTVGATSARARVGQGQLDALVVSWAEALTALVSVPWSEQPVGDVLDRLRGRVPAATTARDAANGDG